MAPLDAPMMRLTRGRLHFGKGTIPMVVLRSTGAKSGFPRDVPLGYFTDGDDVILIASNYGQTRHPSWYYNLLKNPQCQVFPEGRTDRGGHFVARPTEGEDRDRLFALAEGLRVQLRVVRGENGRRPHDQRVSPVPCRAIGAGFSRRTIRRPLRVHLARRTLGDSAWNRPTTRR